MQPSSISSCFSVHLYPIINLWLVQESRSRQRKKEQKPMVRRYGGYHVVAFVGSGYLFSCLCAS